MYVCIDLERLAPLYKGPDASALLNRANIEAPRSAIRVQGIEDDSFAHFTDYELKVLYDHMSGQKFNGYNRGLLVREVKALVEALPETPTNPANVLAQVEYLERTVRIGELQNGEYRYVHNGNEPAQQPDVFNVLALVTTPGHQPDGKQRYFARSPVPSVVNAVEPPKPNPLIPDAHVPTPRDPNAPRAESSGPPKTGSKTGRVWEIADQCFQQHPTLDKTLRGLVAAACESEGINSSTMSVQFSKWKHSKS